MGSYRDAQPTDETAAAGGLKRCTWSHRHVRGFEDEDENEAPGEWRQSVLVRAFAYESFRPWAMVFNRYAVASTATLSAFNSSAVNSISPAFALAIACSLLRAPTKA